VPTEFTTWLGGGVALVVIYIVISNTLWLLFGSRVIQCLPGVNITGFKGTIKIAMLILLSLLGTLCWVFKFILTFISRNHPRPVLSMEVSFMIQKGARILTKLTGNQ